MPARTNPLRFFTPIALALLLPTCGSPTRLLVVVDTDLPEAAWACQVDSLRIDVTGPTTANAPVIVSLQPGVRTLPQVQPLVPGSDPSAPVTVTATLVHAGTPLISRTVRTHYVPGESHQVHLTLWSACLHVTCGADMTCGDSGACEPTDIEHPESLPRWTGRTPPVCDTSNSPCGDAGVATRVVDLSAGTNQTCAVQASGRAYCWGDDTRGKIGNGQLATNVPTPVPVMNVTDAVQITTSDTNSCVLRRGGSVVCWGASDGGALGDGTPSDAGPRSAAAAPVTMLTDAAEVRLGTGFGCARRTSGTVVCWGANDAGQLGDGTFVSRGTPGDVGLTNVTQLSVGWESACALRTDDTVWCWGRFDLLAGSAVQLHPTQIANLDNAVGVAVGRRAACALRCNGTVSCWGGNDSLELGIGASDATVAPTTTVSGLTDAVSIAANGSHACAVRANGAVECWGNDADGQLGLGTTHDHGQPPGPVVGIDDATAVSLGENHTCAIRVTGVSCWGSHPQIGTGAEQDSATPVSVVLPH